MVELAGSQKKYLRGLAHAYMPVVQVGEAGINRAVIAAVAEALLAHELIKVRMHAPEDKKAMAAELAKKCRAALCGLVGHTVILYKPHPKKPKIHLPEPRG